MGFMDIKIQYTLCIHHFCRIHKVIFVPLSEVQRLHHVLHDHCLPKAIPCIGLGNVPGTCIALRDCRSIADRIRQDSRNAGLIQEIRRTSQVCTTSRTHVCCPGAVAQIPTAAVAPTMSSYIANSDGLTPGLRLPTFDDNCGVLRESVFSQKIIGGRPPAIGTWPWIALLGYTGSTGVTFNCGGSVITKRHVLTAAHCIKTNLALVRFGEHDLNNDTETRHIDINIRKSVRHSDFVKDAHAGRNDIAILYMDQDIPFTEFIRPVCLPTTDSLRSNSFVGFSPLVAGWGRISTRSFNTSAVLQQVQIKVYSNIDCENVYRRAGKITDNEFIDQAFICAGEKTGGKDTCQGDSGGPLVAAHNRGGRQYHLIQIGIIQSENGCGIPNAPSLYARTSYYIDWIEQKISEPF